jgi:hypothetical protein
MRIILPKFFLATAVIAATALTTNTAMAQKRLNVPFNFTVDGQNWPAGVYEVEKDSSGEVVTLRSIDASKTASFIMHAGDPEPTDRRVMLKFDDAGSIHALRSVQYESLTSRILKYNKHADYSSSRLSQGR